jgi:hypothetical protein
MKKTSLSLPLALIGLCLALPTVSASAAPDEPTLAGPALEFVRRALPEGLLESPRDGRALFTEVLAGPAFVRGAAGPFDVYVFVGDALPTSVEAFKVLDEVLRTLRPAAAQVSQRWPEGGGGLISAARLSLVMVDPGANGESYRQILALLDHCEKLGYSGWAPAGEVDTAANRAAEIARTWEVQVHNLAHRAIADRRDKWLGHGVGYYALSLVANRALLQGAWGLVPPWLAQGLIDELDVAAYGEAWIGQEGWTQSTPGWFRPGWCGFLPEGALPPPPDPGPAEALSVNVKKTGDPWLDYEASRTHHWADLVGDRKSEAPASFARSAEHETFLPRDRAAARCLLALMLEVAPDQAMPLTARLDRPVHMGVDGMPDSDPLPVIFAQALGGVPEVDRLESLATRALLEEVGRADLIQRLTALGAQGVLELSDHREQSRWLYAQPRFTMEDRVAIFSAILQAEHAQQMAEWKALSARLDRGLEAALGAGRAYPVKQRDVTKVAEAFRAGLASEPEPQKRGSAKDARRVGSSARR